VRERIPRESDFTLSSSEHPQFDQEAPIAAETHDVGADPYGPHAAPGSDLAAAPTPAPPIEDPVWNAWDVLVVVFLTLIAMVVFPLGLAGLARILFYPHTGIIDLLQQKPILALGAQLFIDAAWAASIFLLVEGKYEVPFWNAIRWNWPKSKWMMLAFGVATFIVLATLGNFLPMPKETPFEKLFEQTRDAYLLAILAVTVAPFTEELFFRGFLYPVLAKYLGAGWGVFLAAVPFALLHLPQYGFSWGIIVVILGVGIVCGVVRAATKSVGASFLVHAGYNGAQMLIAVVYTHGFTRAPK